MLSFCALILIDICIPQDLVPMTKFGAMYTSAELKTRNAKARAAQEKSGTVIEVFRSDAWFGVAQASPAINRACNAQTCVYYRRHCNSDHECRYAIATLTRETSGAGQNPVFARSLRLAAPDAAAFGRLAGRLTFKMANDESAGPPEARAIAVRDLEQESPDTKIPQRPLVHRRKFIPP